MKRCKCYHWREEHSIRGRECSVIIAKSEYDGHVEEVKCRCIRFEEKQ